jgi:hypothetical protein
MKSSLVLFLCFAGTCFGQQQPPVDKAFIGVWNLDVSKSKYAPGTAPKGGVVIVNHNGYVATYQEPAPGSPQALAVAIVRGECYLIGSFSPTSSCTANTSNPRRPSLTLKLTEAVIKMESELTGEATMIVRSTLTPSTGGSITSDSVYTRATQPPAPAKK